MKRKDRNKGKLIAGMAAALFVILLMSKDVMAHNIPAYQKKDIYETERVTISGITVDEVINATVSPVVTKSVTQPVVFKIFNSTTQEIEQTVKARDGKLPELSLVNNHNYIIFAEDTQYRMPHVYVWVKDGLLYNIKSDFSEGVYDYKTVGNLRLYKRENKAPESDRRVTADTQILYGSAPLPKVRVKLVSDIETIETECVDGKLVMEDESSGEARYPALLEDVTYMVMVEDEKYGTAPFPLVAKDKAEYMEGKFFYDHSDCKRMDVGKHYLVNKADIHKNDTTIVSASDGTMAEGLNFKDFLLLEHNLDGSAVKGLGENDYDIFDIKVINPHRWEVSKLAAGEYRITKKIDGNKKVKNVYYVEDGDNLKKLDFDRIDAHTVRFVTNSLSLYPVVMEYEKEVTSVDETPKAIKVSAISINTSASYKIAAGKRAKLTAEILPDNASDKTVGWKSSNNRYAAVNPEGKVTTKKAGAGKTVKIIVDAKDGSGKKSECKIKIMKHAVKKIILKAPRTARAGKKIRVKATVKTTGKKANKKLEWNSSNTTYATVNEKGVVAVKKAGKGKAVKITAKATDGSGKKKAVAIRIK